MKKQYMFVILIFILLYMLYLVLSYKYTEYKIERYTQTIESLNVTYQEKIDEAQAILENKSTRAYKNKILKSQQSLKNPGEEVVFLIDEDSYNTYTQPIKQVDNTFTPINILDEQNLIDTMTVYQKWVYLLFHKDIR